MNKLSDIPLYFVVSVKEAIKYGFSPLSQLRKIRRPIKFEGFPQCPGKYASKEENTGAKERKLEKRGQKARISRNHEKKYRFKRVLSAYFKVAGMIH